MMEVEGFGNIGSGYIGPKVDKEVEGALAGLVDETA